MLSYERKSRKRLGKRLILAGVVLLALGLLLEAQLRPLIERSAEYMLKVAAERIINDVIYSELSSDDYDYEDIVNIVYDGGDNGEVKSISANMRVVNRLKSHTALLINEAVSSLEAQDIAVSVGTASGISILYGRGPLIPVRVEPKGYASVTVYSEFSSAGINQTLHRIVMQTEADIAMIIPAFSKTVTVSTEFIIAETVIVGAVPRVYAELSGDGKIFGGA